jgi:hypothetical protein
MKEVTGGWKKLHKEELRDFFTIHQLLLLGSINSKRIRWAGHVARMVTTRNAYKILTKNPEGKRLNGRSKLFNLAPHHEGVMREWRHSSTHS